MDEKEARDNRNRENGAGGERGDKFMRGMICGILLCLACMALSLGFYRFRMERRMEHLRSLVPETAQKQTDTETEASRLELDYDRIEEKLREMGGIIDEYYLDDMDSTRVEEEIYGGMLYGLDDAYAQYYNKQNVVQLSEETKGVYTGIGISLYAEEETGALTVEECFAGTPAAQAGVQPGDVIVGFNGESTEDMELSELVDQIRSSTDERLTLHIRRGEEELSLQIDRGSIEVPTVEYKMLEDQIGYLRILEFDEVTTKQFAEAMDALEKEGMERLIIDVRGNPGGVLPVVCSVLDRMLPEGLIVYTEDKHGERSEYFSDDKEQFDKPLAVLINEESASAAEIFAGAIKDYGIGTLVGTTTFGKGIVQRVFDLSDGTAMKLTIAKYYTPNGTDIHKKGISPGVEVAQEQEGDSQLEAAVHILQAEMEK